MPADGARQDLDQLLREHLVLLRSHAQAQDHATRALAQQARDIAGLRAEVVRLRGALVRAGSALAWAEEDRAALERATPGLEKRVALARQVRELQGRIQDLMHEAHRRDAFRQGDTPLRCDRLAGDEVDADLDAGLAQADLVICQTGCLSHGAYWRVQDHCRRTGKVCMLVDQPGAIQIVRIQRVETA